MESAPPPLIGLTTYGRDEKNQVYLPAEYGDAVRRAGGIPVLIPPGEKRWRELLDHLDGCILSGGGDLDPALYGGQPHPSIYMVDPERDELEVTLARALFERDLPVLGICRGAQVLNIARGGTLIEHLPDEVGESVLHRLPPREPGPHPVTIEPGSRLASILEEVETECASWHHQAIRELAPGFRVTARAADGTLEAFEDPEHPWLVAVQWHPELTAHESPAQQRLFEALVKAASERASRRGRATPDFPI